MGWKRTGRRYIPQSNIPEVEFLTKSTAEGLRVTIKSIIDLSKHLLEECGFKYGLSSKMNQDRLEVK